MLIYTMDNVIGTMHTMTVDLNDYPLSTRQAAEVSGISSKELRRYANAKRVRAIQLGRDWFFNEESLRELVENKKPPGRPIPSSYISKTN